MKAMIFSAGYGTRLHPLTQDIPKALAPIANTTLLAYNLEFLSSQGISGFVVNTHHFAEKIENYLKQNDFFGLDIHISLEKELLDTAGGVAKVREMLKQEDHVLLYNVDVISNINIEKMYEFHCKNKSDITLATRKRSTSRYLLFDDNNILQGWKNEKTRETILCGYDKFKQKLAFSGISLLNTYTLDDIGEIEKKSLIDFYLTNCQKYKISAFNHDTDVWYDCGTVEKLKNAEKFLKNKV